MVCKVNIGMPIYNEQDNIHQAIESVLNQKYTDWKLIICDNCSEDNTLQICQEYALKDSRIIIVSNKDNIGAAENFKKVFELSNSEYFVWISGHDIWHPMFIEECVRSLDDNPSVVLCHTKSKWIDQEGTEIDTIGRGIETRGLDIISRFHIVLWGMGYASAIYGLIRSSTLSQTKLGSKVVGTDHILLSELSLLGDITYIDQPLHYVRKIDDFGNWESYIKKIFNQDLSDFSATELFWNMICEYLKIINRHVEEHETRYVLSSSTVSCLLTKYKWILIGLGSNNFVATEISSKAEKGIDYLLNNIAQSGVNIEYIYQLFDEDKKPARKVVIDGVFFQLFNTGIARVWQSLLEEWASTNFADEIIVLDRAGTAPVIQGISYQPTPRYNYDDIDADRVLLQQLCDKLGAQVFISTYYTTPLSTPSVFMGYDMIPELFGVDLNQPVWQEKKRSILQASAHLNISGNTAKDLIDLYPDIDPEKVIVAHCGTQPVFCPANNDEIQDFCNRYGIKKPYFMIGSSSEHKNPELFFKAFSELKNKLEFEILITGGHQLRAEILEYIKGNIFHCLRLEDQDLKIAYSGAIALIYPSKYEGFGLPIVEAFASACPVITCPCGSIPEVAGEAAIYVLPNDVASMTDALNCVQQPEVRNTLIEAGLKQVKKFSWKKMADIIQETLLNQTIAYVNFQPKNFIIFPDWSADEESVGEELVNIVGTLIQSSEQNEKSLLLIDTTNAPEDEAVEMLLSGIAMHFMMSEGIDVSELLEIACIGNLSTMQWELILPKIQSKIGLKLEDSSRTSQFKLAVHNI
jgi:glycosyltransferase involved in cell wall biosynthesis